MTSASSASFGTDEHPEVTEISDLTEGLLSPERSADVRAHLSGCGLCADVRTSLEEIRGALGTLPGPARIPSDVAGRIDAALAAEALLDASAPNAGSSETRETPRPGVETGEPPVVSRETRETATLCTVSRETGSSGRTTDRPAGHSRGAAGPGRPARRRPRRWRTALLGTAGTAAVLTLGALFLPGLGPSFSGDARQGVASDTARSESDRADEVLEARVRSLLADGEAGKPEQESRGNPGKAAPDAPDFTTKASPESQNTGAPGSGTPTVPRCVSEGIGRQDVPLAVGMYVYEGQQTYIVVLPHGTDSTRVDAYVVDADCVGEASPSPGTVITTRTYPR